MPSQIEQIQQRYRDRLTVVAIDIQENRDTVATWAKDKSLSFTILLDPDGAVTGDYGVTATPTVFVLSRQGKLIGKALGNKGWSTERGRALLDRLTGS